MPFLDLNMAFDILFQIRLEMTKKILSIPNPIDIELYKPVAKIKVRKSLKLPLEKKLILIGAMNLKDERKGFRYLIEALNL